jgi:hypothetical protein
MRASFGITHARHILAAKHVDITVARHLQARVGARQGSAAVVSCLSERGHAAGRQHHLTKPVVLQSYLGIFRILFINVCELSLQASAAGCHGRVTSSAWRECQFELEANQGRFCRVALQNLNQTLVS